MSISVKDFVTEFTLRRVVVKIKDDLGTVKAGSKESIALKSIGRYVLNLFTFTNKEWVKEYEQIFAEEFAYVG